MHTPHVERFYSLRLWVTSEPCNGNTVVVQINIRRKGEPLYLSLQHGMHKSNENTCRNITCSSITERSLPFTYRNFGNLGAPAAETVSRTKGRFGVFAHRLPFL